MCDNSKFRKIDSNIRPSYKLPNPHEIGGILLEKMHEFEMKTYENGLNGQF